MKTKEFVQELDDQRIVAAIAESERHTSGEIRVFISSNEIEDAYERAKARFLALGMDQTRDRNAVLIDLDVVGHISSTPSAPRT